MVGLNDEPYAALMSWRAEYRRGLSRGAFAEGKKRGPELGAMLDITEALAPNDTARALGLKRVIEVERELYVAVNAIFAAMHALNDVVSALPPRSESATSAETSGLPAPGDCELK